MPAHDPAEPLGPDDPLRRLTRDAFAADAPQLADPLGYARRVIATAAAPARESLEERIRAALAEADALPAYERPETLREKVGWVKTRLYGHAPLPADRMVAFLLAFAAVERQRQQEAAVVPDGSTVHAHAGAATACESPPVAREADALLATDRALGELYLMGRYAGQPPEALAALTGQAVGHVVGELAAAAEWLGEESRLSRGVGAPA